MQHHLREHNGVEAPTKQNHRIFKQHSQLNATRQRFCNAVLPLRVRTASKRTIKYLATLWWWILKRYWEQCTAVAVLYFKFVNGHPSSVMVKREDSSIFLFIACNSDTSQFDHKYLPFKKSASPLHNQVMNAPGRVSAFQFLSARATRVLRFSQ